jgi:hypothetical protein
VKVLVFGALKLSFSPPPFSLFIIAAIPNSRRWRLWRLSGCVLGFWVSQVKVRRTGRCLLSQASRKAKHLKRGGEGGLPGGCGASGI